MLGQENKVGGSTYVWVSVYYWPWRPNGWSDRDREGIVRRIGTPERQWCQTRSDWYDQARATCHCLNPCKINRKRLQVKPFGARQRTQRTDCPHGRMCAFVIVLAEICDEHMPEAGIFIGVGSSEFVIFFSQQNQTRYSGTLGKLFLGTCK